MTLLNLFGTDRTPSVEFKLKKFQSFFSGEIYTDEATRLLYSTDASHYQIKPKAVVYPKTDLDLYNIVLFCKINQVPLIPRTAGTSLGGQVVGDAIIVDVSKYLTQILEINSEEKWAIVQPGVVRDELNLALKPYGLLFGPNTSTSNRAMIGGMVGNNSSGSYSIKYGTTRENVLSIHGYLSDGSEVEFGDVTDEELREKSLGRTLESTIYRQLSFELSHPINQDYIRRYYPKASIHRRNTGYALDAMLNMNPYTPEGEPFNLSKLICGSEGTLMLMSKIKVKLWDIPTEDKALLCFHFDSLQKSLEATPISMKLKPNLCELMDKKILDCTRDNIQQEKNRFFLQGDPQAILMIEVEAKPDKTLDQQIQEMNLALSSLSYAMSDLRGGDMKKALDLRASGLGVLQNLKGDKKSIEFVEDTAVDVEDLPKYIADFEQLMRNHNTESIYYAHAGAGELHIRPQLNLKTPQGKIKYREIAEASSDLIIDYRGSLSGEHGDGIVRSEFIPKVLGYKNYEIIKRIKQTWDPDGILNPFKIVDPYPMDTHLKDMEVMHDLPTTFTRFSKDGSLLDAVEQCSGSGDCRKSTKIGGTMCPSYQADPMERNSTRARANILRAYLSNPDTVDVFQKEDIKKILDLCLGCKACISECPSSVNMAQVKSEFLYQYYQVHPRTPLEKLMGSFYKQVSRAKSFTGIINLGLQIPGMESLGKKILKIDHRRSLPKLSKKTFQSWYEKNKLTPPSNPIDVVYLYVDEFINFLESEIGIHTYLLLNKLGVEVRILPFVDSARSQISKGFLEEARNAIDFMVNSWSETEGNDYKIIGIEPSAILGIRDDFGDLISKEYLPKLEKIKSKTQLIEEYLSSLFTQYPDLVHKFNDLPIEIIFHGHCHQKTLSESQFALNILNFPKNFKAKEIPSGCCGMAGSFGYDYVDFSFQVGEMVLFPSIRQKLTSEIVSASGTSCRHQIKDGTSAQALHPVTILYQNLR